MENTRRSRCLNAEAPYVSIRVNGADEEQPYISVVCSESGKDEPSITDDEVSTLVSWFKFILFETISIIFTLSVTA